MKFQELLSRPKIAQALGFAIAKHGDQKYGDKPYQVHLLAVAETVFQVFSVMDDHTADTVFSAALLHDTLEDTDATSDEILALFGAEVLDIVQACTKTDDDLCRSCSFKRTVPKLEAVPHAKMVKMADRLANMRNSLANRSSHLNMYVREYREFRYLLHQDGELEALWQMLDDTYKLGEQKKK